jgi:PAS domain S-box-containing protein
MEIVRRTWQRWRAGGEQSAPGLDALLLAHYPGAVMLLDEQGVVLRVNPDFERHAGYPPDQLLGRRAVTLDADPLHGGFALALDHCFTTRQAWRGVLLCRRADGALRHQTTMIQPLEERPGGPLRLLVIQYDVTGMRERELHDRQLLARLEGTVSHLPGAVFRLRQDAAGHLELLYASEGLVALIGQTPERVMVDIERLRRAVEEIVLEVEGATIRFTVSLGLAILLPNGSLEGALGDADRALYRAKHEGRNRICGPGGASPLPRDADPA